MKTLSAILAASTVALSVSVPAVASGMTMNPEGDRCEITLSASEQKSFDQALRDAGLEVESVNAGSLLSFDTKTAQEYIDHAHMLNVLHGSAYQNAKKKLQANRDLPEKDKYEQVLLVWRYEHLQYKLPDISRACLKGQKFITSLIKPPTGPCFPDLTSPTYLPTPIYPTLEPLFPTSSGASPQHIRPNPNCLAPNPTSPSSPVLTPPVPTPFLPPSSPAPANPPSTATGTPTVSTTTPVQPDGESSLDPKAVPGIAITVAVIVIAALFTTIANFSDFLRKINPFQR